MTKSDQLATAAHIEKLLALVPHHGLLKVERVLQRIVRKNWDRPETFRLQGNHLTLVTSGRATFQVNGETVPLRRGCILFASQGCEQSYIQDPDDPPTIITARFDLVMHASGGSPTQPGSRGFYLVVTPRADAYFITLMKQLLRCWGRCPDPLAERAAAALLHLLLWALREECFEGEPESRDIVMEDTRLLLESDPVANWSVAELALRLGLSEGHFSRRFRRHTGMPPKTYQLRSRMRYARQLLQDEGMTVQQVAEHLGYSDAFVFSRQFKKLWGVPPSRVP